MRILIYLLILLLTPLDLVSAVEAPPPDGFDLFLLVGQSNMAGRGKLAEEDRTPHPRVLTFSADEQWVPAVDPLHFDKPAVVGVGLGRTFGIEIAQRSPGVTVGLIPCAVGGSPIDAWTPGSYYAPTKSHPWDDAIRRAKAAMQHGKLRGILWHQGESDSRGELAEAYQQKLDDLIHRFRKELDAPEVPVIVGQLGQFPERPWSESRRTVDRAHRELPQRVARTAFVSSDGLVHGGDEVHFDAASYREFGRRFAQAYLMTAGVSSNSGFAVEPQQDRLLIMLDGNPIVDFVFRDDKILRPYFANARLADGLQVTRHHPPTAGVDALDHDTMHPGIWLGFGDISGHDFWRNKGTIEHLRFVSEPQVADGRLSFATESRLTTSSGEPLCSMTNDFKLVQRPCGWLLIWGATFHADHGPLVFGDQGEMGFAARVATQLAEKNGGVIRSSTGRVSAAETWGQSAMWCDYSGTGPNSGEILLMASPDNFRESWWHNRDYGVFVANPFGRQAMQQGARSEIIVAQGETMRIEYGALIHDHREFDMSAEYDLFSDTKTGALEPHPARGTGD